MKHYYLFPLGLFLLCINYKTLGQVCLLEQSQPTQSGCQSMITTEEINALGDFNIKLNFHFINGAGEPNFQCADPGAAYYAPTYIDELLMYANNNFSSMEEASPNPGGAAHIEELGFNYVNASEFEGNDPCDAIYFWDNTDHVNQNPNALDIVIDGRNDDCSSSTQGKWAESSNSILIFHLMCKVFDNNETLAQSYRLLNHELGHAFGLNHAYDNDNQCAGVDMDLATECDHCDPNKVHDITALSCPPPPGRVRRCTYNATNNLMGYNDSENAVTPCQAGYMYNHIMSTRPSWVGFENLCNTFDDVIVENGQLITWDHPKYVSGDIIIESGGELIVNCDVYINGEIVVKRGAKMTLNSKSIQPLCNDTWLGLSVWGNSTVSHQSVDLNSLNYNDPGVLIINSGRFVKAQSTAVRLHRRGGHYPEYWGGIIQAQYTGFVDCWKGVEFLRYDHPNASFFEDCYFISDRGFGGVSMWAVHDIEFRRCRFEDLGTNDDYGIRSINSEYTVSDDSEFNNLHYGIYCTNIDPLGLDIIIGDDNEERNTFNECFYGVFMNSTLGVEINSNYFEHCHYGIYGEGIIQYNILNNEFFQSSYRDIESRTFSPWDNRIKCNEFKSPGRTSIFLRFHNSQLEFNNNLFQSSRGVLGHLAELRDQGTHGQPAANEWMTTIEEMRYLLSSSSSPLMNYWHPDETNPLTNSDLIPDCALLNGCNSLGYDDRNSAITLSERNGCTGSGGGDPLEGLSITVQEYYDKQDELSNSQQIIDGGDTDYLLSLIETSPLSNITLDIINSSIPFLSDTVLASITRSVDYQSGYKRDCLTEHCPLSTELLDLSESNLTYSDHQIVLTTQSMSPYSEMDSLNSEIDEMESDLTLLFRYLYIEAIENEDISLSDSLYNSFNVIDKGNLQFFKYLYSNEYSQAAAYLDTMTVYDQDDQAFQTMYNWYIDWILSNYTQTIDSVIIDSLESMASFTEREQYAIARSLLTLWTDTLFEAVIDTSGYEELRTFDKKLKQNSSQPKSIIESNSMLKVQPNPSNGEFLVHLSPMTDEKIWIRLIDNRGVVITDKVYQLKTETGELRFNNLEPGVYLLQCESAQRSMSIKVVILR